MEISSSSTASSFGDGFTVVGGIVSSECSAYASSLSVEDLFMHFLEDRMIK